MNLIYTVSETIVDSEVRSHFPPSEIRFPSFGTRAPRNFLDIEELYNFFFLLVYNRLL